MSPQTVEASGLVRPTSPSLRRPQSLDAKALDLSNDEPPLGVDAT